MERTLVLLKPDAMERRLVGKIINRFEEEGFKIVAMKMAKVDKKFADKHYAATDEQILGMGKKTLDTAGSEAKKIFGTDDPRKIGETLRQWSVDFITSSPVIAMVLEREDAIAYARKIGGFTDPARADKGTIRRDFGKDSILQANREKRATQNLVHLSGNKEEAEKEIKLWFG
ncbi:MAG: nucleoside-diphosphate kinase [Candidatus Aenigmarchaeota archaeon]|nr:nucleoside-diphosphate kinase [Candidatus Aenigmarchaeota archaeon]